MNSNLSEFIDKEHVYAVKKIGTSFSVEQVEDVMKKFNDAVYLLTLSDNALRMLKAFRDYYASALIFEYKMNKGIVYIDYYDPFLEKVNQVGIDEIYNPNIDVSFLRALPLPKVNEMLKYMDKHIRVYYLENDDKLMFFKSEKHISVIACFVKESQGEPRNDETSTK